MSKSEKRHFKLENSYRNRKPNYLLLFEAMEKQEPYDEDALKANFGDSKAVKQFHVLKNYLRSSILKSLRNFHITSHKEIEIRNCLSNLEILFNKELYQLCKVELKRATHLAKTYEQFGALYEVQNWKRKLAQTDNPANYDAFQEILDEQAVSLNKLSNQHAYNQLILNVSKRLVANDTEVVDGEELLLDASNAYSFESSVMHYNARYLRSLQRRDPEKIKAGLKDLDRFFDKHPFQIANKPGLYISSINNIISYHAFEEDYDTCYRLIEKLKVFYKKVKRSSENKTLLKQVLRLHNTEIETYRKLDIINEKDKEIKAIEDLVVKNRDKMPKDYLISFWFQFAGLSFLKKEYSRALYWINEILNTRFGDTRADLQLHIRLLNLIIHFERQDLFVLRYYLDSTKRFAKKLEVKDEFIQAFLQFFSNIGRAPLLEYKQHFLKLQQVINQTQDEEIYRPKSGYIDYEKWVLSHL